MGFSVFFFSGLLDWIMLIMAWFERFFPPPQVRWQSYIWPLKLMTSKVVEGKWIQAQVVQGWMGQYTAQQTAGTSKIKKCWTRLIWDAYFLTSSRSLRKLLNVGTNSILVISLPRTNASSWIEKANVLLTFHYKTKIKSIKMFCYRIILLHNFLSINLLMVYIWYHSSHFNWQDRVQRKSFLQLAIRASWS